MATNLKTSNGMHLIMAGVMLVTGCSDKFMKSSPRSKTTALATLAAEVDAAGNVTASFDPKSTSVQVLKLSTGTLAGSAIAIPPGSLALPVSITVGEGETLVSSTFSQDLGLTDNAMTAVGPSVSFMPSQEVQAISPFTLSIPFSSTSLFLLDSNENLMVLYRAMKVDDGKTSFVMGMIPGDDVTISNNKVSFQTTKFGVFQLGKSEKKITEAVSKPTIEAPALKGNASNPLVGTWGMCRAKGGGSDSGGTSSPIYWSTLENRYQQSATYPFGFISKVEISWSGGSGQYKLERFDNANCSGTASSSDLNGNFYTDTWGTAPEEVSYKVTDAANSSQSSSCYTVYPIGASETIPIQGLEIKSGALRISWDSTTSGKLKKFSGFGCSGSVLSEDTPPAGSTYYVDNSISKDDKYSYQFYNSSNVSTSVCLSGMGTQVLPEDWSGNNTTSLNCANGYQFCNVNVTVNFTRSTGTSLPEYTKVGAFNYRSFLGRRDYEFSTNLSAGSTGVSTPIITGLFHDSGKPLTLWAPWGCHFVTPSNTSSQSLAVNGTNFSITSTGNLIDATPNSVAPSQLVCDGKDSNSNSGGGTQTGGNMNDPGDTFGMYPSTTFSMMQTIKISTSVFNQRTDKFISSDCSGKPISSITESGSYVLPDVDVPGTIPLDVTAKESYGVLFAPESNDIAKKYPEMFGCGLTDWLINTPRSLEGTGCAKIGVTEYIRVKIDGNKLYSCENDTGYDYGNTADTRIPDCSGIKATDYLEKK